MEETSMDSVESTESTESQEQSYDAGYKEDYSVPTTEETPEVEPEQDYSQEEINSAMLDYLKENFDLPDKFKDVGSLINSYKHLESKMGSLKGAPDTYEIDADIYDNYSEDMLGELSNVAREMGLDNDGMNKMLAAASRQQTMEANAKWEMEKHSLGKFADEEISQAQQFLSANYSPDIANELTGMVQTAAQFRALKAAVMGNRPSTPAANTQAQSTVSEESVNKMLFAKDEHGNNRMETDSNYANKVMGMMHQIHG